MKGKKHLFGQLCSLLLAILMIFGIMMLSACSLVSEKLDDTAPPIEESEVEGEPEALPAVEVSMPDYELTYAGELEDIIVVNELPETDKGSLEFRVKLSSGEHTIFVLCFNSDQGELVTVLTDAKGEKVPVAFEMAEVPAGLSEADEETFYIAQDAVNEIVGSLKLK